MLYSLRSSRAVGLLLGFAVASLVGLGVQTARADDAIKTATAASVHRSKAVLHTRSRNHSIPRRYFVEFRARNAATYGHMYVMYGRVNSREQIVESHISGFFPAGDKRGCANCSVVNWSVGHVIFVPGEIGASDGDLEEKYVLYRYRVWVSRAEYKRVVAYIKNKEAHVPLWNALWKNCVDYGRGVAEFMHLNVPFFIWLEPKDFVRSLAFANGVKKEQLPLKDAATSLRSSVHSASRRPPLPPQRPKNSAAPSAAVAPAGSNPEKQAAAAASGKPDVKAEAKSEAKAGAKPVRAEPKSRAKAEMKAKIKAEIKTEAMASRTAH